MLTTRDRLELGNQGNRGCSSCLHFYCDGGNPPCNTCRPATGCDPAGKPSRWESCREAVRLMD